MPTTDPNFNKSQTGPNPPSQIQPREEPKSPAPSGLTPEEQMALFEKELRENDWGHQPC